MSVSIYITMQIMNKPENYANARHIHFIPVNIIYI